MMPAEFIMKNMNKLYEKIRKKEVLLIKTDGYITIIGVF